MNTVTKIDNALKDTKPSKLEKIKMFLLGDTKKLSKIQEIELEKYIKVQALLESGYTKSQVIKLIQQQGILEVDKTPNLRQAYNIYNDTIQLLGDISKVNKQAERHFSREKYLKLSKQAENVGDYVNAGKLRKLADEVIGLFEFDEQENAKPSMYFQQVIINRRSDEQTLKNMQTRKYKGLDAKDIDYDTID